MTLPPLTKIETGIYEHYKGMRYDVLYAARHSETLEEFVVYRALYGSFDIWIRPLKMFFETIVLDGKEVPRFRYIRPLA